MVKNLLDGSYGASFRVGVDAEQTISFNMQKVGGTALANSLSVTVASRYPGIAGVASEVTGDTISGEAVLLALKRINVCLLV